MMNIINIKILYTIFILIICIISYYNIKEKAYSLAFIIVTGIIATIIGAFLIPSNISLFDIYEHIKEGKNDIDSISPYIKLNVNSLDLICTDTFDLEANTFQNDYETKWKSDDIDIVTVDNEGHLEAISEGDTKITATIIYNNVEYTDTCIIKVRKPIINLYFSDIFSVGDTKSLSVFTIPEETNLIWYSNNSDIVTVNDNGEIKCIAEGTATITAIMVYNGQNYSADCDIKVNAILGNDTASLDIAEQHGDIKPEISAPEDPVTEPAEPEISASEDPALEIVESGPVVSTLAFSDDVKVIIDPNAKYTFSLNGYVSSNYELRTIKFEFITPENRWPYGKHEYNYHGPKIYYLSDLNETINAEAFNFGYSYNGNFELIITVEDSFGNNISKKINWSY